MFTEMMERDKIRFSFLKKMNIRKIFIIYFNYKYTIIYYLFNKIVYHYF
jgi:hypothetical protein